MGFLVPSLLRFAYALLVMTMVFSDGQLISQNKNSFFLIEGGYLGYEQPYSMNQLRIYSLWIISHIFKSSRGYIEVDLEALIYLVKINEHDNLKSLWIKTYQD